ncbi:hypothetical protein GIB67_021541 [Kingdonia uniflora]|uniref:Aminotransferase-like plant mobile domain-containing protein n=1 Tax=Kingdonia uniflora TaxID=39325 RepID=A0A7J7L9K6_9MAGN|nr:hypothetical protein GIB67_021541 [Kingdonia uniflora]
MPNTSQYKNRHVRQLFSPPDNQFQSQDLESRHHTGVGTDDFDLKAFKSLKAEGAGNSLSLKKLKFHYAYKLEKVLSDGTAAAAKKKKELTARSIARAYMLYVIGSFLFPMKKGTDVSARYLVLFAKDEVAKKWSWGSAVLAYMYYNLGAASRDDARQFACCTTLLESWIFPYFSKLGGIPKEMDSDTYEHCTCWKWDVSITDRYGGTALLNFREVLDNYKLEDVVWDPYRDTRDSPHAFKEVNFFYETCSALLPKKSCAVVQSGTRDPHKATIDRDDYGIHQRKPASVNEHGDTPVYQSEDIAEQYDVSHHEHSSRSPNINLIDQQITALNDQLQKLKEDKEKESEANINLREAHKEKLAVLQSHQPVPDTTLAKKYEDLLAAHDDMKKKWIAKEDFRQKLVNAEERMKSLEVNNSEWICHILNSCTYLRFLCVMHGFKIMLLKSNIVEFDNYEFYFELCMHKKLVNSEERKKTLEVDNNEWEVWRQALKKALATEGMGDMGDPTFKELFE